MDEVSHGFECIFFPLSSLVLLLLMSLIGLLAASLLVLIGDVSMGSEGGLLLEAGRLMLESFGGGVGATVELTIGPDSDNAGGDKDKLAFVSSVFGPLR